jgi:prolipoprotein diacylglyceryl transferase
MLDRSIPTPSISEVVIGPLHFHFYALCIIAGIAVAIYVGNRRFIALGGGASVVADVAIVAVPSGIIGGRIYHVITSPDNYFGNSANFLDVFKIWEGGLGIWGAISLGAFGAWIALKRIPAARNSQPFRVFLDALAPALLLAQAIGRFGNWFNAELFGRPTSLPWGLEIPMADRPFKYESFTTFHPTFLYEALWCIALALLLIRIEKRVQPGQLFSLYVAGYCVGRFFIELLRVDSASIVLGLRINVWVSLLVFSGAVVAYFRFARKVR